MTLRKATICPKWLLEAAIADIERTLLAERAQTTVIINRECLVQHLAAMRAIYAQRFGTDARDTFVETVERVLAHRL